MKDKRLSHVELEIERIVNSYTAINFDLYLSVNPSHRIPTLVRVCLSPCVGLAYRKIHENRAQTNYGSVFSLSKKIFTTTNQKKRLKLC